MGANERETAPRRASLFPFLIAAFLLVALGITAWFIVNQFGLASEPSSIRMVSVVKTSIISNGYEFESTETYRRDAHGNLECIYYDGSNDGVEFDGWTFTCDADGIPHPVEAPFSISSTKDDYGRVALLRYESAEGVIVSAAYEYYGDTDKVKSITYHPESAGDYTEIFADKSDPMSNAISSICASVSLGDCAPFFSLARTNLCNSADCCITFDKDGKLVAYDEGGETVDATDFDHASHTAAAVPITTSTDERLGRCETAIAFDDNGQACSLETKWNNSDTISNRQIEYCDVEEPSRWVATIGQLH